MPSAARNQWFERKSPYPLSATYFDRRPFLLKYYPTSSPSWLASFRVQQQWRRRRRYNSTLRYLLSRRDSNSSASWRLQKSQLQAETTRCVFRLATPPPQPSSSSSSSSSSLLASVSSVSFSYLTVGWFVPSSLRGATAAILRPEPLLTPSLGNDSIITRASYSYSYTQYTVHSTPRYHIIHVRPRCWAPVKQSSNKYKLSKHGRVDS